MPLAPSLKVAAALLGAVVVPAALFAHYGLPALTASLSTPGPPHGPHPADPVPPEDVHRHLAPPGAPVDLRAEPGDAAGRAALSWDAPASDGGLPLLGYVVTHAPPDQASSRLHLPAEARRAAFADLASGDHRFTVAARNGLGEGAGATVAFSVAPPPPPPPSEPVGGDAPSHTPEPSSSPPAPPAPREGSTPSGNASTSSPAVGGGSASPPARPVSVGASRTAGSPPGAVQGLAAGEGAGPGEIVLVWDAAASSTPLLAYHVAAGVAPEALARVQTLPASELGATLGGLSPGGTYHVQVTAENAAGEGPPSPPAAFVAGGAPALPVPDLATLVLASAGLAAVALYVRRGARP